MLRLLIDQDLDHDILRGLIRRIQHLNALTALEAGFSEASDRELLLWAPREGRVTVTHDRRTMPGHASELIAEGTTVAGVVIAPGTLPLHQVIDELDRLVTCSENDEWLNVICYLPF